MKLIGLRKGREDVELGAVKPHESWRIEGDFIVIFDANDTRTARRIPSDVMRILESA